MVLRRRRVSLRVVLERVCVGLRILQRLAEREMEMIAVLLADIGPRDLPAHDVDVVGLEAERLEVGEAPPCLARLGRSSMLLR